MANDRALVAALLAGDETVFSALVERLHGRIVRLCRRFVASDAAAEDVAQDTWQAVLQGLAGFEGRSALDTWILQIAVNRARSRGVSDARVTPLDGPELALESRFHWDGRWKEAPRADGFAPASPESVAADRELLALVASALDQLPEQQRLVVTLRDVERLSAAEVCDVLQLSDDNQRVLLHRGRARLRAIIDKAL
jgi:RNA polymerase sigma-70 factor (ECF subfamily)